MQLVVAQQLAQHTPTFSPHAHICRSLYCCCRTRNILLEALPSGHPSRPVSSDNRTENEGIVYYKVPLREVPKGVAQARHPNTSNI